MHLPVAPAVTVFLILVVVASGNTITVGPSNCDYNSIQTAVQRASPGDSIKVMSGIYKENIDVNKQLVLLGIGMPVIDAKHNKSAIILSGDRCKIEGFKVINSSTCGISLLSDFNRVENNILVYNGIGIYLEKSHNNIISNNNVFAEGWWNSGLFLKSSNYNTIKNNNISYNGIWGSGITLVDSNYNNLTGNKANAEGLLSCEGISLKYSNANLILGNTVKGSGWEGFGIHLDSANYNNIKNNNACCSNWGMYLDVSFNNTIEYNIAKDIRLGIYLYSGRYNAINDNIANIQLMCFGPNTVEGNHGWVYEGSIDP